MDGNSARKAFRKDINGLRAWAVLAVVLYHFHVPGFQGGFVGVDIFFVISGFLMTGIVVGGLEGHSFEFGKFFFARAVRIIPGLLTVCLVVLLIGIAFLPAADLLALGGHTISSATFLSNFVFWREAGYFDVVSHEKWLLHTWSLSLEWQFYLVLPFVLAGLWRIRPGWRIQRGVFFLVFFFSLSLSIFLSSKSPGASFFLIPTRAWELVGGGLAFFYSKEAVIGRSLREFVGLAGLALIVVSIFYFSPLWVWPSGYALVPVLGTMLVLVVNASNIFTSAAVMQWLGDRSYSLYLWHWPVFVGLTYLERQTEPESVIAGLGLAVLFACISYSTIERPARVLLSSSLRTGRKVLVFAYASLFALAGYVVASDGFPSRLPAVVDQISAEAKNYNLRREECFTIAGSQSPSCLHGSGVAGVVGVGDSHLNAVVSALSSSLEGSGVGVIEWSHSGCVFVDDLKISPLGSLFKLGEAHGCADFIAWVTKQLNNVPKEVPVVVVGRYAFAAFGYNEDAVGMSVPEVYFSKVYSSGEPEFITEFSEKITSTACRIAKDRPVFLVRPIPEMRIDVPKVLSRRIATGRFDGDVSVSLDEYRSRNEWVLKAQDKARDLCGVHVLDPLPYLCDGERCFGSKNGWPIYRDDDHLSEHGNKLLIPMFAEVARYVVNNVKDSR